jgi:beta-ribofuranosylaminobenzene 5'-phosphate synthase
MRVYVRAPARLHLGILDLAGDLGRLFGGMGVAINSPSVIVEAEKSLQLTVKGESKDLAKTWINLFTQKYHADSKVAVNIRSVIPQHVGLGSGTQLALATSTALAKLFGVKASTQELAATMGRGSISGVGTALFECGGFVVEAGIKSVKNKPISSRSGFPPVMFQESFPADWFFVIGIPQVKDGLSGEVEAQAFKKLPPMSKEQAGEVSHLVLMSLLPALKEEDIETFGASLTRVQEIVGDCFASAQSGRFSNPVSGDCVQYMLKHGAFGAGQSSWGPTVYGLVQSEKAAEKLASEVNGFLRKKVGGTVFYSRINNRGAYIRTNR